jgi:hypothetical protein
MGKYFDFATNPKVPVPPGAYFADFLTDHAEKFIDKNSVGRILAKLDELKVAEITIVIFASDTRPFAPARQPGGDAVPDRSRRRPAPRLGGSRGLAARLTLLGNQSTNSVTGNGLLLFDVPVAVRLFDGRTAWKGFVLPWCDGRRILCRDVGGSAISFLGFAHRGVPSWLNTWQTGNAVMPFHADFIVVTQIHSDVSSEKAPHAFQDVRVRITDSCARN